MGELSLTDYLERKRSDHVEEIALALEDIAAEVRREGARHDRASVDGTPRFSQSTSRVLHAVTWGVANLPSQRLLDVSAQLDVVEARDGSGEAP